MSEAFSLKQFGFNNTLGDPNQLDYTMQDVSAFSKMETLPPMPVYNNNNNNNQNHDTLYQQAPLPQQPPVNTSSQLLSFVPNTTTSIPPPQPTIPPATSMPPTHPLLDSNNEGLFRNNPNNPFFGIPTSMDWTEWNEWSQSNQGNTTWQPLA